MYSARITRDTPTAFIFLIDQSGSMEEKMDIGKIKISKADIVAKVTNLLLMELVYRCKKEEGVMDYFDIAAIGYSDEKSNMLLGTKNSFISTSKLAMTSCKKRLFNEELIDSEGVWRAVTKEIKYWIEPKASGNTPMKDALEQAYMLTSQWCRKSTNQSSYPPTIINITDGEATDGSHEDLCALAGEIKSLGTTDGNALFININISSNACDHTIIFPGSKSELPECRYTSMLYDMASEMPESYNDAIQRQKQETKPPFRGMSLNTSAENLIMMMNIGSLSKNSML